MQESAMEASAALGLTREAYMEREEGWVIRRSSIDYLIPLEMRKTVRVRTWVEAFRGPGAYRRYEFIDEQGRTASRAETEWIYMDLARNRPKPCPKDVVDAFLGGEVNRKDAYKPPKVEREVGSLSDRIAFSIERQVEHRDIDTEWHVNNAVYVSYMEESALRQCAAFGWPVQRMIDEGFLIVARSYQIDYLQPAFLGDTLGVTTWVRYARGIKAERDFQIHRISDGAVLARASSLWVWVDRYTGRPIKIPGNFLAECAEALPDSKGG